MGLNPAGIRYEELKKKILDDNFNGGSPYFGMYWAGYYGVDFDACVEKCWRNGIVLREKDVRSYNEGVAQRGSGQMIRVNGAVPIGKAEIPFESMRLADLPMLPAGWTGTQKRFFPCSQDNRPMQKWGWNRLEDGTIYKPELYDVADAKALSPCGWVGQNLLYQKFVVLDIDGRGHGCDDQEVIEFGSQFRNTTFMMEDPMKPGSFHLYFETDRLVPVRHFPWAKLDLMGNAVNAAVYLKNKKPNGLPMRKLDDEVWNKIIEYQKRRKEK